MSCGASKNSILFLQDQIKKFFTFYYFIKTDETTNLFRLKRRGSFGERFCEICIKTINIFVPIQRKYAQRSQLSFMTKNLQKKS